MKAKRTKFPKKKATPIHLESIFGTVEQLRFDHGGHVRIELHSQAFVMLLEAFEQYSLRRHRIPPPKVIAAIDTLREYFLPVRDLVLTADVLISSHAVVLEPLVPGPDGEQRTDALFPRDTR